MRLDVLTATLTPHVGLRFTIAYGSCAIASVRVACLLCTTAAVPSRAA